MPNGQTINHSHQGASWPNQASPSGQQKVVYLTFDDGPEPGTLELANFLNKKGIPATFFFVGENVLAAERGIFTRWGMKKGMFCNFFEAKNIQIGNHSQTQSHQFYLSYYDEGLRINANTKRPDGIKYADQKKAPKFGRRSPLVDFELANVAFSYALSGNAGAYESAVQALKDHGYRDKDVAEEFKKAGLTYQRFLTARLPGTNRWRIPRKTGSAWDTGADRDDDADQLYKNGYRIYGWDLEWKMTDKPSAMSVDVRKEHLAGKDGWWSYYGANVLKDRPKQTPETMFEATQAQMGPSLRERIWRGGSDKKVVILMHDRQFRPITDYDPSKNPVFQKYSQACTPANPEGNPYISMLESFVSQCLRAGFKFDVLANY